MLNIVFYDNLYFYEQSFLKRGSYSEILLFMLVEPIKNNIATKLSFFGFGNHERYDTSISTNGTILYSYWGLQMYEHVLNKAVIYTRQQRV